MLVVDSIVSLNLSPLNRSMPSLRQLARSGSARHKLSQALVRVPTYSAHLNPVSGRTLLGSETTMNQGSRKSSVKVSGSRQKRKMVRARQMVRASGQGAELGRRLMDRRLQHRTGRRPLAAQDSGA